jgi:TonB family protein
METVAQPPAEADLNFLTQWGNPVDRARTQRAGVMSVLLHVVGITLLVILPPEVVQRPPEPPQTKTIVTPLIEPITELTQKAPNTGKVRKEITAAEITPRPRIQIPAPTPSTSRPRAEHLAPTPSLPTPMPAPASLPEPPKLETAVKEPPKPDFPVVTPVPAPQIQGEEKAKSPFLTPSAPAPSGITRPQAAPSGTVAEAVRQLSRGGSAGGGTTVGDQDVGGIGGVGSGINLPPSPGSQASQIQLLSDPLGVDFRPYLIRVMTSVKQHWIAILPESARMGRRGKVAIQFAISRDGQVPKLVIATPSGAEALDRAAVAGISASVPFPPLPSEFKGDRVVLQFNFAYNIK